MDAEAGVDDEEVFGVGEREFKEEDAGREVVDVGDAVADEGAAELGGDDLDVEGGEALFHDGSAGGRWVVGEVRGCRGEVLEGSGMTQWRGKVQESWRWVRGHTMETRCCSQRTGISIDFDSNWCCEFMVWESIGFLFRSALCDTYRMRL